MSGQYFSTSRNIELSTIEYIETQINASWSGVTTVKTFKNAYDSNLPVPIICVRLDSTNNNRRELGSDSLENRYNIIVDIFARSAAQRTDLTDFIVDQLKNGWPYKTYAHVVGDRGQIIGSAWGRLYVTSWNSNSPLDFGEQGDPKDRYRHIISVSVRRSSNSSSSSSSSSSCRSSSSSSSCRSSSSSSSSSLGA